MSLFGDLASKVESAILKKITDLLKPVLDPLKKLWGILKGFFTAIVEVVPKTIHLIHSVIDEIQAFRDFKKGINFKTGVINLQSARDRIEDLITEVLDAWHSIVDLATNGLKGSAKPFQDAAEAASELANLFDGLGDLGLEEFVSKVGDTFKKFGGKIFEVLAIIQYVAEQIVKVVDEFQSVVDAVTDIRKTFQTGEGLFLPQTNPRKKMKLQSGGSINIRVGNLH